MRDRRWLSWCGWRGGASVAWRPAAPGGGAGARPPQRGGEANLILPDLRQVTFLGGIDGHTLLLVGLVVCGARAALRSGDLHQLKNLPVHPSMREISELIYETCKTYLIQQGKFLLILELFIGTIIAFYFGVLQHFDAPQGRDHPGLQPGRHRGQLRRRVVRHPRQHVRQLAHGVRGARGQAVPLLRDSAQGRHEHRHAAHQRRAADHALHPAVHSGRLRGPVLHRLRHRRVAGRRRRCASRAASSRRSPTSAPT